MSGIIALSVRYRVLVLLLSLIVLALGLYDARFLPIDAVPDVTPNQVMVMTRAPGLAPLEIERLVTAPLEQVMSGLPRLKRIRSVSKYGLSVVYIQFDDGYDFNLARDQVFQRMNEARERIPRGFGAPEMGPVTTGLGEIYQFQVRGAGRSLMDLRSILEWDIAPKLRLVPGVVEININGGELKTYEVRVHADQLLRYGIGLDQVLRALEANNGARGGAALERNGEQELIRGEALIQGVSDIATIVLAASADGTPVYVRDVADVVIAPRVRLGAVTRDGGGEIVIGTVMMLIGENAGIVIDRVKAVLAAVAPSLPPGVSVDAFYDRTELVDRTIGTVIRNLSEGAVLVVAVLLLMLGNVRGGLIVACVIPLSLVVALIGMYHSGLSGNLMSLGAIDFGLIVDGSVVIIENVMSRRGRPDGPAGGPGDFGVVAAAQEVVRPVVFAVAIIIMVYLPVLALEGVEGRMFRPMAFTVIFALCASLVLSVTLMPALATWMFSDQMPRRDPFVVSALRRAYRPLLRGAMARPLVTTAAAVAMLALSGLIASRMGAEFLPRLDEGSLTVTSLRLPGVALETSVANTTLIEKILKRFPEVITTVSVTGSAEIPVDPMGLEETDTLVTLKPRDQWRSANTPDGLIDKINTALEENVPGTAFSYLQPIAMRMQDLLVGVHSDIAVVIYGDDLDVLKRKADAIQRVLEHIPGASDTHTEQIAGLPSLRIKIDREAIARYGMNADQVLDLVESMGGRVVGQVIEGPRRFDVVVRLAAADRADVEGIRALRLRDPRGRLVALGQVADIAVEEGAAEITHERLQRRISVETNVRGRDLTSFVADAQRAIDRSVKLPPGYLLEWGGQLENLKEATARLAVVVPIALCLIFALLFTAFNALGLALLVFVNVPIAASGGVLSLYLSGQPFSISAAIGFVALFGVAVLNGVVLVSSVEIRRRTTPDLMTAIREGALARMRPVLITALVASLGFLPMALSNGAGAEVQRPLATVVIGGLISSTLLTLLVLPAVYRWFTLLGDRTAPAAARSAERPAE
ncbi:MAG TPA: CusA/CzcA family heavy metal efflux RND transporter [Candidatus Sulfotelmatobacter sp.]|nr:CusA/CzcA family heavy metal efflux RND transporter [Candidatus Sulfotelmatobacter sp.]